jgi:S-adenosylmethionine:tRNA ribosyltransferase-isomerase
MEHCARAERVVAVGTTTVRALESAASRHELDGRTDIFIHRGYDWRVVDVLMTNFHLPKTTLLMMIDAFVGDRWRRLYDTALHEQYRFLSFGDAMLLDRHA